jgi:hypothetical protein
MRPLDHLVLPVTTLALARSRLTGLGFTVAPDARHPFGTGNCCVFFGNRTYLEPITVLDRAAADLAAAEGAFFVRRVKGFVDGRGEGFAMLAFRSKDAERDLRDFERAGLAAGPAFRFSRPAAQPDGSEAEVGVVLAYADDPRAPDATFFACQHLSPDALFAPAYLAHPNGALGVAAVAAVAEDPARFTDLLSAAAGSEIAEDEAGAVVARLDGQRVSILTAARFRERYGLDAPDPGRGLLLAASEVLVADLDRAIGYAGPLAMRKDDQIVVPPSPGLGAVLTFRAADG